MINTQNQNGQMKQEPVAAHEEVKPVDAAAKDATEATEPKDTK